MNNIIKETYIENNKSLLNDWWFKKFFYPETPNSEYAECHYPQMALVNQNKCFYNEDNIHKTYYNNLTRMNY